LIDKSGSSALNPLRRTADDELSEYRRAIERRKLIYDRTGNWNCPRPKFATDTFRRAHRRDGDIAETPSASKQESTLNSPLVFNSRSNKDFRGRFWRCCCLHSSELFIILESLTFFDDIIFLTFNKIMCKNTSRI